MHHKSDRQPKKSKTNFSSSFCAYFTRTLLLFTCIIGNCRAEDEEPSQSLWDYHPIHVGGNLIYIGKADIDGPQHGHLVFQKQNIYLNMLVPISATSYFFPRIDWNHFILDWNKNPKFNETEFQYVQFGLMFYSTSLEKWRWILRAEYSLDLDHFSMPSMYGQFSGLIWGAYELHKKWHYHVGATGYAGLRGDIVYPIIGLDFSPNKHWTFEAIFPITYSIQYKLDPNWRFSIKGRPLKERFRTGTGQPQPRSIFNYSSVGTELNIHYEIPMRFEIEAYAGYNFGGKFYIKNQGGHKALYTDVEGAPYVGGNLDYAF